MFFDDEGGQPAPEGNAPAGDAPAGDAPAGDAPAMDGGGGGCSSC